jgi:DNA-binding transcriptional LysR family regulator
MEFRRLEYLIAVAEEANFTRAAARVHVSQSGISAQIRQLEADLGATLIDRSGRNATLIAAGAAALPHARAALASAGVFGQAIDEVNGLIRGDLVIGMVTACTVTPPFDILATYHLAHPGVAISVVKDRSDRLSERVRSGTTDLALVGSVGAAPADLESLLLVDENLVAAAPRSPSRRGASHHAGWPERLPHRVPACRDRLRAVFDQACADLGVKPDIALEASAPAAVVDLAARDLGVAVLSESMAVTESDRLVVVALDGVETRAVLALVWNVTESPALRELVRHCCQTLDVMVPAATAATVTGHAAR